MKVVFVRPLRLEYHMSRLHREYELQDVPDVVEALKVAFAMEMMKEPTEMSPVFIDLVELLLITLSSYGVQLDFFSLVDIEPVDECRSLLIKVL